MVWPIEDNLAEIRRRQLHYVVAGRHPERDRWLDEFEEPEGFELIPRAAVAAESVPEEDRHPG